MYIVLILASIPEVKIIYIKLNPAATCWSNFKHYFPAKGFGYSYNLSDTVLYFKLYKCLMSFWDGLCLFPEKNKCSTKTASQFQVKQKVYQGSSQNWQKFEPYFDCIFSKLTY